jgi:hypothetical protein
VFAICSDHIACPRLKAPHFAQRISLNPISDRTGVVGLSVGNYDLYGGLLFCKTYGLSAIQSQNDLTPPLPLDDLPGLATSLASQTPPRAGLSPSKTKPGNVCPLFATIEIALPRHRSMQGQGLSEQPAAGLCRSSLGECSPASHRDA